MEYSGGTFPITEYGIIDQAPYVPWQVRFLSDVHRNMREHKAPVVRTKFLTAWDFYAKRYPELIKALVDSDFSLSSLAPDAAWEGEVIAMNKDIKHFKRIGSGTPLSVQLTKRGQYKSAKQ